MKKSRFLWLIALVIGLPIIALATPSSEFWTVGTTDIQAYGIGHLGIDNYFHFQKHTNEDAFAVFPTDIGYTVGILPFSKVQMEIGVDLMGAQNFPVMFNAKAGIPEDGFFKGQPGIAVGIFNIGTRKDVTDLDITYAVIGKTLPLIGRVFVGGYVENNKTLNDLDPANGAFNRGLTFAWDRAFLPTKSASGAAYNRLLLCADWATGKNSYGGGGPGVAYSFTENISILTGPVFFLDQTINGKWKWSTQLDVNFKTW